MRVRVGKERRRRCACGSVKSGGGDARAGRWRGEEEGGRGEDMVGIVCHWPVEHHRRQYRKELPCCRPL